MSFSSIYIVHKNSDNIHRHLVLTKDLHITAKPQSFPSMSAEQMPSEQCVLNKTIEQKMNFVVLKLHLSTEFGFVLD